MNGNLREVPATEVREIARRGDSVMNGLLIGAAFGAGAVAGASSDCEEPYPGMACASLLPLAQLPSAWSTVELAP